MIVLVFVFPVLMTLYFGAIRLLDSKQKEFLQFLVMYAFALLCMLCLSYIIAFEIASENWCLHFHPVRDQLSMVAYYIPPTFITAYLLYPFKIIKRNRILVLVLLGLTIILVGWLTLVTILVSFSNM